MHFFLLVCSITGRKGPLHWGGEIRKKPEMRVSMISDMSLFFLLLFLRPIPFIDIETGCLEEKSKRDHFTQLVLACLVSCTFSFCSVKNLLCQNMTGKLDVVSLYWRFFEEKVLM